MAMTFPPYEYEVQPGTGITLQPEIGNYDDYANNYGTGEYGYDETNLVSGLDDYSFNNNYGNAYNDIYGNYENNEYYDNIPRPTGSAGLGAPTIPAYNNDIYGNYEDNADSLDYYPEFDLTEIEGLDTLATGASLNDQTLQQPAIDYGPLLPQTTLPTKFEKPTQPFKIPEQTTGAAVGNPFLELTPAIGNYQNYENYDLPTQPSLINLAGQKTQPLDYNYDYGKEIAPTTPVNLDNKLDSINFLGLDDLDSYEYEGTEMVAPMEYEEYPIQISQPTEPTIDLVGNSEIDTDSEVFATVSSKQPIDLTANDTDGVSKLSEQVSSCHHICKISVILLRILRTSYRIF